MRRSIPLALISLFVLISFALSACQGSDTKQLDSPVAKEDKSIILSENGVGPINGTSSFNMHQMTLAFNDFNVIEEVNFHQGSPYPVIRVSDGVKTLLIINPDASRQNIFSIIIEDNLVKNSLGHRLGTPYADIYTEGKKTECQLGAEDMSGKMICYAPEHANILYVFNGKSNNGKAPTADVLQGWALESIIWRPKS